MIKKSGSEVIWEYFMEHIGEEVSLNVLNKISEDAGLHHWDRVVRNWKQQGWQFENKKGKWYKLKSLERLPQKGIRKNISKKTRFLVFERDNYRCQACGKTVKEDNIKLVVDHKVPVDWGGDTVLDNLQALCSECNDGKKAWINGEDYAVMSEVSKQTSTKERLRVYFLAHPNEEVDVDRLAVVAKTREWTREVRKLRAEYGMNLKPLRRNKKENRIKDTYIYIKED